MDLHVFGFMKGSYVSLHVNSLVHRAMILLRFINICKRIEFKGFTEILYRFFYVVFVHIEAIPKYITCMIVVTFLSTFLHKTFLQTWMDMISLPKFRACWDTEHAQFDTMS